MGPVEAIIGGERGGGGGTGGEVQVSLHVIAFSCALSIFDFSEQLTAALASARFNPRPPALPPPPPPLHREFAIYSPAKENLVPGRADSRRPYAPRTSSHPHPHSRRARQ